MFLSTLFFLILTVLAKESSLFSSEIEGVEKALENVIRSLENIKPRSCLKKLLQPKSWEKSSKSERKIDAYIKHNSDYKKAFAKIEKVLKVYN